MTLWNTAGGTDYGGLRPLSYPNTDIFLLCARVGSITQHDTMRNKWIPEMRQWCPEAPILLVGIKDDPEDKESIEPTVSETWAYGQLLAQSLGAVQYLECDSVTQASLQNVFDTVS